MVRGLLRRRSVSQQKETEQQGEWSQTSDSTSFFCGLIAVSLCVWGNKECLVKECSYCRLQSGRVYDGFMSGSVL